MTQKYDWNSTECFSVKHNIIQSEKGMEKVFKKESDQRGRVIDLMKHYQEQTYLNGRR